MLGAPTAHLRCVAQRARARSYPMRRDSRRSTRTPSPFATCVWTRVPQRMPGESQIQRVERRVTGVDRVRADDVALEHRRGSCGREPAALRTAGALLPGPLAPGNVSIAFCLDFLSRRVGSVERQEGPERLPSYVRSRIARRLRSACRAAPNFIPRQVARLAPSATILPRDHLVHLGENRLPTRRAPKRQMTRSDALPDQRVLRRVRRSMVRPAEAHSRSHVGTSAHSAPTAASLAAARSGMSVRGYDGHHLGDACAQDEQPEQGPETLLGGERRILRDGECHERPPGRPPAPPCTARCPQSASPRQKADACRRVARTDEATTCLRWLAEGRRYQPAHGTRLRRVDRVLLVDGEEGQSGKRDEGAGG
jgi:hypothetical protein